MEHTSVRSVCVQHRIVVQNRAFSGAATLPSLETNNCQNLHKSNIRAPEQAQMKLTDSAGRGERGPHAAGQSDREGVKTTHAAEGGDGMGTEAMRLMDRQSNKQGDGFQVTII
jgi:hypothetical protein